MAACTDLRLNIVVVEDYRPLREMTVATLRQTGHRVIGIDCAEAFLDEGARHRVDILIVDLNLPGDDGLQLARRFRVAQPAAGIIMVTARKEVRDRVQGYSAGADIYLSKPVAPAELLAAVDALGRRVALTISAQFLQNASLELDVARQRLRGPMHAVGISTHEVLILSAFARAPRGELETWQIIELISADTETYSAATLAVRMTRLRAKLEDAGAPEGCLKSIRNAGYRLMISLTIL